MVTLKLKLIMKKRYLIFAAALLAAVGCHKEMTDGAMPAGSVILKATVESDGTKVGASVNKEENTVAFTWTKGDAIAVETTGGYETFTLVGDGGSATGEFSGNVSVPAGAKAVFPAAAASASADINLPAEYNYVAGQTNALLLASVTAGGEMGFKHLGGLVSLELKGVPAGAKFVLTAAGQKINGAYSVTEGQVDVVATEVAEESSVAVKFAEYTSSAVVYVPLPVGEYAALKAQVLGADGTVLSEIAAAETKTFARKSLKAMPHMIVDLKDWFVTPEGAGDKSGTSWDNAMGVNELREFIAQPLNEEGAQADNKAHYMARVLDGATINMAAGDYYLAGAGNKEVKVEFSKYEKQVEITFEGGYPADLTGISKAGRDTTSLISAFTGNQESSIFLFGNQTDITFDGITFKDGNQNNVNGGVVCGSAGASGNCTLTFNSCRFINNKNGSGNTGASLFFNKCVSVVSNCYFAGNYARNGSAINMAAHPGDCTVANCVFENNSTANTSGAVQNGGKTATFTDCIFKKNKAGSWGGGAFHTGGSAKTTFTECDFIENTAPQAGAVSIEEATCTFTDCTFQKNSATKSDWEADADKSAGGAINMRKDAAVCTLNNCTFEENTASAGNGGAIASPNGTATLTINAGTSFKNNTSKYVGGAIYMKCNMSITGTSDKKVSFIGCNTLETAKAGANGGAIWRGGDKALTIKHALFSNCEAGKESGSTVDYSNGGAIYTGATGAMTVENCEFTGGRARNGGAVAMGGNTTYKFKDCKFHSIICLSGANHDGTGGNFNGAVAQIGAGKVEFEGCLFENNDVQGCSSVLHANGENVIARFTDCQLLNNRSRNASPSAACIRLETEGIRLYMNRCLIKGNQGVSRGIIQLNNANTLAYLNDVTFVDNYTTATGNTWGVNIHSGYANICMNNVTSYNNYNPNAVAGNSVVSFNSDGGWLIVNSTIIDKTPLALVRSNGTKENNVQKVKKVSLCNNVLINTMTAANVFLCNQASQFVDGGHNVLSCSGAHNNATPVSTDLLSQSTTTLGGSYSANWTATHPYGVYLWTNALANFSPATSADVYDAISAYTETDSKVVSSGNIGADFYKWLKEIGAVTESGDTKVFNDARGVARTGNYWPGAYQAN